MMQNPMKLMQQFNQFRQTVTGDPQQIVMDMVRSGRISQAQLNQAQQTAMQLQNLFSKSGQI